MSTVIASLLLPDEIVTELSMLGVQCLQGFKNPLINNETAYHPDMMFYKLLSGKLLTSDNITSVHNLDIFVDVVYSKHVPNDGYPDDCILNCFTTNNCLICGNSAVDEIIEDARLANLEIIKMRQGYCACSTIKINEEAFISSDTGIVKALKATGHDALLVANDGIQLKGYNNGFIGGCALSINNIVAFTGAIEKHKDYENIKAFSNNFGKTVVSLTNNTLYDYGGFIAL